MHFSPLSILCLNYIFIFSFLKEIIDKLMTLKNNHKDKSTPLFDYYHHSLPALPSATVCQALTGRPTKPRHYILRPSYRNFTVMFVWGFGVWGVGDLGFWGGNTPVVTWAYTLLCAQESLLEGLRRIIWGARD